MHRTIARLLSLIALLAAGPAAPAEEPIDLEPYRGKVVLLDFWASWCAPCARSFPWMAEMEAKHGADGLVIVTVGLDEDPSAAARFLERQPGSFRHLSDPAGEIAEALGVQAMPTSILYDREGRPAFVHSGFHPERRAEYEQHLVALLEGEVRGGSATLPQGGEPERRLGVRPWQRGTLAQEDMRLDCAPLDLATDDHIYFSKEASSGGRGFGGGGCGCN